MKIFQGAWLSEERRLADSNCCHLSHDVKQEIPANRRFFRRIAAVRSGEHRSVYGRRVRDALLEKGRELQGLRHGWIYFIQEEHGAVKIGFATSPKRRLRELQTANPGELTLRAAVEAPLTLEKVIRAELGDACIAREWFVDSDEVMAVVEAFAEVTPWSELA